MLDNKTDKLSKFRTKNWIQIDDQSREVYSTGSDIRFKTTMLKSSLCDNGGEYILVNGTITIAAEGGTDAAKRADERNKGVIFKNYAPFTNCKSEINNTGIDNAKYINIVMPMYNLIKYSDDYSKASTSLWQYYKDEPNDNLTDSESFKSKVKITGSTPNNGNTRNVEIIVPLKYLSNFWGSLEMSLINCEIHLILTWSIGEEKFKTTDTKYYVPVVTLSTEDNTKLLQQLKSGFKRTINWNKYQSDPKTYAQNRYLNHLVDPSFQRINKFFVLSFENGNDRTSHSSSYLPKLTIKDYNVIVHSKNFFDQPTNSKFSTRY